MNVTEEIDTAARELKSALTRIQEEIAAYPTPIAGCDEQFTHLLETRIRVQNALNCLGTEVFVPTPRTLSPGAGVESR